MNTITIIVIAVALVSLGIYTVILHSRVATYKDEINKRNTKINVLTIANNKLEMENNTLHNEVATLTVANASFADSAEMYKDQYEGAMMVLDEYAKKWKNAEKLAHDYECKCTQLTKMCTDVMEDVWYYKQLITGDVDNWN